MTPLRSDGASGDTGLPAHVSVETVLGTLLYPAGDKVMLPAVRDHGIWDPLGCAAIAALVAPGSRVVDVGAHVGFMTLACARAAGPDGQLTAIEAARDNYALLSHNVQQHAPATVRTIHGAAWNHGGTVELSLSAENTGDHRAYRHEDASGTETVPAFPLDDVLDPDARVDVVKIDAQGCDHVVLEGMTRTLERWRPTVIAEFWPPGIEELGDDPANVIRQLRAYGYDLCVLEDPAAGSQESAEAMVRRARSAPGEHVNVVMHPRAARSGARASALGARGFARLRAWGRRTRAS